MKNSEGRGGGNRTVALTRDSALGVPLKKKLHPVVTAFGGNRDPYDQRV